MEIIRHLSADELIDLTIESDRQSLRQTLESLPDWARSSTEHSEEFWQKQRDSVWSRISTPQFRAQDRLAQWSPALACSPGGDCSAGGIHSEPCSLRPAA